MARAIKSVTVKPVGTRKVAAVASVVHSRARRARHVAAQHGAVIAIVARIALADAAIHRDLVSVETRIIAGGTHPVVVTLRAVRNARPKISACAAIVAVTRAIGSFTAGPAPAWVARTSQRPKVACAMAGTVQWLSNCCVSQYAVNQLHIRV